jgi:hypothetical protein
VAGQVQDDAADAGNGQAAAAARFGPQPRQIRQQPRDRVRPGFGLQFQTNGFQHGAALQSGHEVVGQVILLGQGHAAGIDPGEKSQGGVGQQPAEKCRRRPFHQVAPGFVVVVHWEDFTLADLPGKA